MDVGGSRLLARLSHSTVTVATQPVADKDLSNPCTRFAAKAVVHIKQLAVCYLLQAVINLHAVIAQMMHRATEMCAPKSALNDEMPTCPIAAI